VKTTGDGFLVEFASPLGGRSVRARSAGGVSGERFSPLNDPSAFRQDLDWFGTLRGRAGIAFDQVLIYTTGVLVNPVPGFGVNSFTTNVGTKGHIGRIGFNYRFGT
jgi:class 3 adenylate cyclase